MFESRICAKASLDAAAGVAVVDDGGVAVADGSDVEFLILPAPSAS